jgi:hypothetical protein
MRPNLEHPLSAWAVHKTGRRDELAAAPAGQFEPRDRPVPPHPNDWTRTPVGGMQVTDWHMQTRRRGGFAGAVASSASSSSSSSGAIGWGALAVIAAIGAVVLFGDKWLKARGG